MNRAWIAGPAAALAAATAVASGGAGTGAPAAACPIPKGSQSVKLSPADFTTRITNPWWPMRAGEPLGLP